MSESQASAPNAFLLALVVLAEHGVDFVLCGGLACLLHGSSRHTRDYDIAVRLDDENLGRLVTAARTRGLQP